MSVSAPVVGAAAASDRGRPARKRRPGRSHSSARSLTPGSALGLGVAMLWFSLLVLIPLSAVVVVAADGGWSNFVDAVTNKQTLASLRLTVFTSIGVTMLNMVMGTIAQGSRAGGRSRR